jgi:hypothetical protein
METQPSPAPAEVQNGTCADVDGISVTHRDLMLGALMLRLVCNWDDWVERRVDSFRFAGDDERVLERHQSVDLVVPQDLLELERSIGEHPTAVPLPITFVNKWRLPQFSLRDEQNRAVPLLARKESTPLAAAMLLSLASLTLVDKIDTLLPFDEGLRTTLIKIATSESVAALQLCASLADETNSDAQTLACDETFMGLAYELARGFPLIGLLPITQQRRRVLKFSYESSVVPARRDPLRVQLGHLYRLLRNRSWDLTETSGWKKRNAKPDGAKATLTLSVQADFVTERLREREREGGMACARALITGPRRRSRTVRLRPNSSMQLHGLPPGRYTVRLRGVSGFTVEEVGPFPINVTGAEEFQIHSSAKRQNVTKPVTQSAPRIAGRAWLGMRLSRALGLNNKPLAIRLRFGHGGSYHCEFEAPDGLHVTRARLVSDVPVPQLAGRTPSASRDREIDVVLESSRRPHLYAPAGKAPPAAAYAYLHLRPRLDTIGRSALLTAAIATAALAFIALTWNAAHGYRGHGPEDSSALLVLILGAPSALAAYFAGSVPSRVANSVLAGLRLAALLPSLLALAAAAVLLVGEHRSHSDEILRLLLAAGGVTSIMLAYSAWLAEHPREQARGNQGPGFQEAYSVPLVPLEPTNSARLPPPVASSTGVRSLLLERTGGLEQGTRRTLLAQHTFLLWRGWSLEVAPALYFDSAETAPTFRGIAEPRARELLNEQVKALATAKKGD